MQLEMYASEIFNMVEKVTPKVLYVGTATYDAASSEKSQTSKLQEMGATVDRITLHENVESATAKFAEADIIVVSGGNTLFAVDRWKHLGIDHLFKQAGDRGCVLSGGSAGAIIAFESGHSDSGDPESFYTSVNMNQHDWTYVRVDGLNLLPGLCCPHYDKVQSNGVLRAIDFDSMLLRHSGECGIGIDHWAALKVDGENYVVLSPPGKEGSVLDDGTFSPERKGRPGVWTLQVVSGDEDDNTVVQRTLAPSSGLLVDLLRPATMLLEDPHIAGIRMKNPASNFEKQVVVDDSVEAASKKE